MDTVANPQTSRNNRFDRTLGSLIGIPGVLSTSAATVRAATPMTGEAQTFIIQTFRRREEKADEDENAPPSEEYVFVEYVDDSGSTRIVIPPNVVRVILRQHDALTARARKRAAKAVAADRKARGILPGFMKHKAKK